MGNFADRLVGAVRQRGTPVLVGLDPRFDALPESIRRTAENGGRAAQAHAFRVFCCGVVDAVHTLVGCVKPQAAFFEELGPPGMEALAEVIVHAREKGLQVVLDGKRNDIGSTASAYANGFLGADASPWRADAITVSPYLGGDSLEPFVDVARQRGAGVFVLVKTSNPGGGMFQDLVADGRPLYRHVGAYVEQLASQTSGDCGYGAVGAVVGATYPEQLAELRAEMPHTWFLVPGYGSQGATARDVAPAFDVNGTGAIVNNSRGIIFAYARHPYAERFGQAGWQEAIEAAARDMIEELRAETPAGRLTGRGAG
ncbi:MAG: orotidine-5'-phosphate decarboxylase [Pirellulales bacterium]|nr:orotidine-5'-phosphate decarboxylase [Pirellulales bacterium]